MHVSNPGDVMVVEFRSHRKPPRSTTSERSGSNRMHEETYLAIEELNPQLTERIARGVLRGMSERRTSVAVSGVTRDKNDLCVL